MNIQRLIEEDLRKFNNKEYIFEKHNGKYSAIRFDDFVFKARALATKLINDSLMGQRIMLVGKNSTNLMIADVAITAYTGVCVNTPAFVNVKDLNGMVKSLGVKAVLFGNDQTEKIAGIKDDILKFKEGKSCN